LERRLNHAAELHLEEMRLALARALQTAPPDVAVALEVVERELDQTVIELHELARGIHPHTLTESGLAAALAELSATAPIEVSVAAPGGRFAPEVEAAAYFVCAEALANVAKHHGQFTTYAGSSGWAEGLELAAGWALLAAGLAIWRLRPGIIAGPLTVAAGFAWFAPDWVGWEGGPALLRTAGMLAAGVWL